MRSDEYLKQAMTEIREPVPEDLERWVLELARTTPIPMKISVFPWHWIWVLLSFVPFILVLGIRYAHRIVDYFPTILILPLGEAILDSMIWSPAILFLILVIIYSLISYRNTLHLRVMIDSVF